MNRDVKARFFVDRRMHVEMAPTATGTITSICGDTLNTAWYARTDRGTGLRRRATYRPSSQDRHFERMNRLHPRRRGHQD